MEDDLVFITLLSTGEGSLSTKLPFAPDAPDSAIARTLLERCVSRVPRERPTAEQAAAMTAPGYMEGKVQHDGGGVVRPRPRVGLGRSGYVKGSAQHNDIGGGAYRRKILSSR